MRASSFRLFLPSLLLTLAVAGCGDKDAKVPASTVTQPSAQAAAAADPAAAPLLAALQKQLDGYRRIIVLLADEEQQSTADRGTSTRVGQQLFHDGLEQRTTIAAQFDTLLRDSSPQRFATLGTVLDYIESAPELFDADRLAFREVLRDLHERVGTDSSLPAVKLHQRIGEDLEALDEIERNYNQELTRIFSRFERTRAIELKREKWDDYIAHLHKDYSREAILRDYGVIEPYPMSMKDSDREIFGRDLPAKTVVLTFDDGPHKAYTDEVVAILKRYDVPGVFFEVGRNLGKVEADGKVSLGPMANISRNLMEEGYAVGNHSLTHAQLSRTTGDALRQQVLDTDTLLKDVDSKRAPLFRFPYGARNAEGLQLLNEAGLKSIMWNIDSMDWADPVPESIVQRVLDQVNKEQRGIILFHDIHDRAVKALPQILDRLIADGYQFAGWNGRDFTVARARKGDTGAATVTTGYEKSWAIVVGIDNYAKWPKLEYASHDAQAVADTLTGQFGFPSSQVIVLKNEQATRNNILAAFHDRLADDRTGKNDRVFVFFAGHGATRQLASGRDLGYIIPVDSDPKEFATDAIAMTDIQNIAESMQAKHVMFVMDACYSGLGLTRGGPSSSSFLRENARRSARQMLTAGGADQQVADAGPNGHSVFTWVLLQALAGKGDLNGDGLITGTELAAYVAPAVSAVSHQIPAFGSLPGSQGGEFVFQVPDSQEFLNADTRQLTADAIALNNKVDAASEAKGAQAPVTVADLQGGKAKLVVPTAGPASDRQRAQQANDRGLQLYREKQYDEAAAQFTEALKLRPDFAQAANNLGFVYYRQQRYAEAARWLENTLKIDPSRAVAYLNLGDAYFNAGDKAKAKQAYTTYLALQPQGSGAAQARTQLEKL
ncbi:tetratricopeptide repeat protein [Stenotrophomonas maltophilia]|uniref:polysaccharide deacetylase family protein n=1 Tax=Stenotrophomonas maltophilia TaxID=40324 RepID=UPI0015DF8C87|nr:polysaccharide deacetylase family protein [Stenotrophomonas maltophilia]MBA0388036.1 tetratricopeptide repeat protein [Stenotrophomonas maltophilia]MBA0392208.1 tetratricopeptide repeat protein [Stenotrophomonas maltophilia]MBA0464811.1 tetratricopeptide repeat protein [Stenotrophomonas maltophilia]MBA0473472.1 tetratricopeptide repeat protein [Stenotrophomonas maltophilia]